jgi:hypothetical protein
MTGLSPRTGLAASAPQVRTAIDSDEDAVIHVVTLAFASDPMVRPCATCAH